MKKILIILISLSFYSCRSVERIIKKNVNLNKTKVEVSTELGVQKTLNTKETILEWRTILTEETLDTLGRVTARKIKLTETVEANTLSSKTEDLELKENKKEEDNSKEVILKDDLKRKFDFGALTVWIIRILIIIGLVLIVFRLVRKGVLG